MIDFLDDGSLQIDFGEGVPTTIQPPKFGAMKRLRAERDKLAINGAKMIAALGGEPEPPEIPEPVEGEELPEQSDDERRMAAIDLATRQREYNRAVEEINLNVSVQWWRLVLIGDETFKGLASPAPPDDPDEWPAGLLFDIKPIPRNADGSINFAGIEPSLLDRIFQHWGKAR